MRCPPTAAAVVFMGVAMSAQAQPPSQPNGGIFFDHPLVVGLIVAIVSPVATILLRRLLRRPEDKRLERLRKESDRRLGASPLINALHGNQLVQIQVNYFAATTAASSQYVATGIGEPTFPEVEPVIRNLPAARITSGERDVRHDT